MTDGAAVPDRPGPDSPGYGLDHLEHGVDHAGYGVDRPGSGDEHRPGGVLVDRHRDRGLDLTPEELVARRKNRRLLVGLVIPSIVVLVLALVATSFFWNNEPSGPQISAPAGYTPVSDGYFSYVVPQSWANNPAFSDDAGDTDTSGPTGWAGEHRAYRFKAPVPGETPPTSLQAFGMPRPESFNLTGEHAVTVPGAATSFAYTATRPGGFHATVIDTWNSHTGVEVWLMVQASPQITDQIVSSLQS